ncbi:unnamed protein product, partial [Laminaria digitata]
RDTKDALVVTNCGAEAIAFLKVLYSITPRVFFCGARAGMARYYS